MANLEGIRVTAYRYNTVAERYESENTAYTIADGTYEVKGLRAGDYKLKFEDTANDAYVKEYHDDVETLDAATSFVVAESAAVTGKDAILTTTATIAGTVTGD